MDEAERPGGPDNLEDNLSARLTVDDIKSHYKSAELDALNNNFNGISPITLTITFDNVLNNSEKLDLGHPNTP